MNTNKSRNSTIWMIRVPNFSPDQKAAIEALAKAKRMQVGAFVGNLLEEVINASSSSAISLSSTHTEEDGAFVSEGGCHV